jgi:ABC-2 type transport system permease protein/lipopolysaccharide transport system permease protein
MTDVAEKLFPSAKTLTVFDPADIPALPPVEDYYHHSFSLFVAWRKLWERRDMVIALAERDIRSSYKQAMLGIGWALISPIISVVLFTIIFTKVKLFHEGHVPYALYAYVGILCWGYFAGSLGAGGSSMVQNMSLLQKTHFPRECFPLSQLLEQCFYTTIALVPLSFLFLYYGFVPKLGGILIFPLFIVIEMIFSMGVVLAMSAMVIYVRDLMQVMGLITTMGLYASPVIWPLTVIPKVWRPYYSFINPIGPVIDGVRRSMLLGQQPVWSLIAIAGVSAVLYFLVGYAIFKRLEVGFADIS